MLMLEYVLNGKYNKKGFNNISDLLDFINVNNISQYTIN